MTKSSKVNLGSVKESARLHQGSMLWKVTTSRMFAIRQTVGRNYNSKSTEERGDNNV